MKDMNYETVSERLMDMFSLEELMEVLDITPETLLKCLCDAGLVDPETLETLHVL